MDIPSVFMRLMVLEKYFLSGLAVPIWDLP